MTTAEPSGSSTEFGLPFSRVIAVFKTSTVRSPLCGICRLGISPACCPSGDSIPCFFAPGLKCPPADVKGGSHLPTAWTWNACSPGGSPLSDALINTPCVVCVRLTEPTSLPSAFFMTTDAVCAVAESVEPKSAMAATTPTLVYFWIVMVSLPELIGKHTVTKCGHRRLDEQSQSRCCEDERSGKSAWCQQNLTTASSTFRIGTGPINSTKNK